MSGLGNFTFTDMAFIEIVLECFCYGLYSAIFFMYIRHHASKEPGIDKMNVLLCALCILYILSVATVVLDITSFILSAVSDLSPNDPRSLRVLLHLFHASVAINGLSDFISQAILIYRCWIVWGCNIRVIIIPAILALAFLTTWVAVIGSSYRVLASESDAHDFLISIVHWGYPVGLTSVFISLIVNAVVIGLIVLRILKVYWEVRSTFAGQTLGVGGAEAKVRSIIFIMIESGVALFAIQLVLFVLTLCQSDAAKVIIGTHQMFNGLTPTIILLRVSMRLSGHDEKSLVETAASWCFADQNPVPETGGVEMAVQEGLDRICLQPCDDVEIVDIHSYGAVARRD